MITASAEFFSIEVDRQTIPARHGQTIAAALAAAGRRVFRRAPDGTFRGLFCGMGVCFECLVTVDGVGEQRACMTLAQPGMRIRLSLGLEGSLEQD
jgi:predicted molibdopterin-dependent oxidoreductase YjgC